MLQENNKEWLKQIGFERDTYPHVLDLPGLTASDGQKAALDAYLKVLELSRVFIMPPGVPDDVKTYWQSNFDKMMTDSTFMEGLTVAGDAEDYGYGKGPAMRAIVDEINALPRDTKDLLVGLSGVDKLSVN